MFVTDILPALTLLLFVLKRRVDGEVTDERLFRKSSKGNGRGLLYVGHNTRSYVGGGIR